MAVKNELRDLLSEPVIGRRKKRRSVETIEEYFQFWREAGLILSRLRALGENHAERENLNRKNVYDTCGTSQPMVQHVWASTVFAIRSSAGKHLVSFSLTRPTVQAIEAKFSKAT